MDGMSALPIDSSPEEPTSTVGVAEAGKTLSRLLDRVEAGEQIIITRGGRPAAVLGPAPRPPFSGQAIGDRLARWFEEFGPDPDFADDIEAAIRDRS
ncbi:hypothetical protein Ppa06_15190 [Planomonospora parontospora subsp. parontospora]|uniref:Antitoxin n=3 Tax=Planomonospora parontospora TaxID=58119 RepID=A0AA37BDT2_9ACTN|nr:hypothetical protein GCM10010126_15740 [Planomonospora parontospora]GII07721.1 hypothetical protein Ppa06_15190 [Planomonospora parontospora subsp. parontospora]